MKFKILDYQENPLLSVELHQEDCLCLVFVLSGCKDNENPYLNQPNVEPDLKARHLAEETAQDVVNILGSVLQEFSKRHSENDK